MTRRRPPRFARVALAALLSLAAAGQVASLVHLVTARHEICAAHGEIADIAPGAASVAPPTDGRASLASLHLESEGDHHCFATAGRRESAGAIPHTLSASLALTEHPAPLGAQGPRPAPRSILEFAPKHSPPDA